MNTTSDALPHGGRLAPDLAAWLTAGAGSGRPCEGVIETSISWVYLYADFALKLKKPVNLGFLDFSTPEKRHWAAARELDFNRATAPDIYKKVHCISRSPDGGLRFDADGEPVDWALEMRRFDENAVLANRLASVDGGFAERLGRDIARFHAASSVVEGRGGAAGIAYVLRSNAHLLRSEADELGVKTVEGLISATDLVFGNLAPLLDSRRKDGFVRYCHGDLHLGNILLENGKPILFDCIEFNDGLREIDILYDVAFLLMDLVFRGASLEANRVMNGWLDESARRFVTPPWAGLAALPLFQSVRAAVRAHVNALEGHYDISRRYLSAAMTFLAAQAPRLIAVGGLSGSGKSTLARALAPGLGAAPGAVILRSDELRKRIWGRAPTDPLPAEAYSRAASDRVYNELFHSARACLEAGRSVIVDAVFLRPDERQRVQETADTLKVTFQGIWLEAPPETLEARVTARRGDASDADSRVLGLQLGVDPGAITWARCANANEPGGLEALQRRLGLPTDSIRP